MYFVSFLKREKKKEKKKDDLSNSSHQSSKNSSISSSHRNLSEIMQSLEILFMRKFIHSTNVDSLL